MKNVILGTSSYSNAKTGNLVSISGDGGLLVNFNGNAYKKLAPRLFTYISYKERYDELINLTSLDEYRKLRKQIEDEYILSYYETRLKTLDVRKLLLELENRFGKDIILLCYEDIKEFCHRRILADYIELETGIYIPEVTVSEDNKVKKINPIRYKNRLKQVIEKSS